MSKVTITKNKPSLAKLMHNDRWVNSTNKFGTSVDPITQTRYEYDNKLSRSELDALFLHDWLVRRVIEIPAKDATRKWITLSHDTKPELAERVRDEMTRLNIREAVQEGITLGRMYGGALMVIGAFDGLEVHEPLGKIRSIEFINNTDRYLTYPQSFYNDENDMRYGSPETYLVQRLQVQGSITSVVHESRTIRFEGNYLPPVARIRNWGWSESVVQNFHEALRQFGVANQSAAATLEDFVTKKMKVSNLVELLSTDDGEAALINRMTMIAQGLSVHKLAIYGDDEEFDKMGTPLTQMPEMLNYFTDYISAAVEIPKARLFHNQSGLLGGDSGGNDLRVHYDNISAYQENTLRPQLRRIIDMISEALGIVPGEIDFTFNPLWQLSEMDEADVRYKTAQTDEVYIRNQVVEPEEVAVSRFSGDETNLMDMTINIDRRVKYLDELAKQPVDVSEPEELDSSKINMDPCNPDLSEPNE